MALILTATLSVALLASVLYFIRQQLIRSRKYRFPNEVPGVPFFGNALQVPEIQQGPWAKGLAEKYGEMFTCRFGLTTWVFLNSSRTVNDLLERRAAIYSSRPPFPMTQNIMSGGGRIVLMPYGDKWRSVRKVMHKVLNARQIDAFQPFQDLESKHLLWEYLHQPDKWWAANARFANSVIMSVVFGRRSLLGDPDSVELFRTIDLFLENQQPGVNLVDSFPFLERLPEFLQWWRPRGQKIYELTRRVYQRELDRLQDKVAKGTARPCFGADFVADPEVDRKMDQNTKLFALGSLIEAGSDTSRVTIGQIIAAAVAYPDWVDRARAELDAVCGANAERLPQCEDRPHLPYITAVTKEGFRWRPNIAEIGAPTMLIQDDEYEGYRFPAGTVFTWNAWAIALDENEYKDPLRFWPERFLNADLENPLKGHWSFGPGRRVCAGWKVGETNVWIAIARLIYCFDFAAVPGEPIDTMRIPQVTQNTAPFAVQVRVRSEAHAALIAKDCSSAVDTVY